MTYFSVEAEAGSEHAELLEQLSLGLDVDPAYRSDVDRTTREYLEGKIPVQELSREALYAKAQEAGIEPSEGLLGIGGTDGAYILDTLTHKQKRYAGGHEANEWLARRKHGNLSDEMIMEILYLDALRKNAYDPDSRIRARARDALGIGLEYVKGGTDPLSKGVRQMLRYGGDGAALDTSYLAADARKLKDNGDAPFWEWALGKAISGMAALPKAAESELWAFLHNYGAPKIDGKVVETLAEAVNRAFGGTAQWAEDVAKEAKEREEKTKKPAEPEKGKKK